MWYERYHITTHTIPCVFKHPPVPVFFFVCLTLAGRTETSVPKYQPRLHNIPQRRRPLKYTAAEDLNLARKGVFLQLMFSDTKYIYIRRVSAYEPDVCLLFHTLVVFHKNHMLKCEYSILESSRLFRVFVLIICSFIIWSNWLLTHSGRPLL